jgi:hypothetical protein
VARFRITVREGGSRPATTEDLEADFCLDVGEWIEFLARSGRTAPTAVRVVARASLARILEIAEPVVVVHLLSDDLSTEEASDLIDDLRPLLESATLTSFNVRGTARLLASPSGAAFVAFLDQAVTRSGKDLHLTALSTLRQPIGDVTRGSGEPRAT